MEDNGWIKWWGVYITIYIFMYIPIYNYQQWNIQNVWVCLKTGIEPQVSHGPFSRINGGSASSFGVSFVSRRTHLYIINYSSYYSIWALLELYICTYIRTHIYYILYYYICRTYQSQTKQGLRSWHVKKGGETRNMYVWVEPSYQNWLSIVGLIHVMVAKLLPKTNSCYCSEMLKGLVEGKIG